MAATSSWWPLALLLVASFLSNVHGIAPAQIPLLSTDKHTMQQGRWHEFELRHIFHHDRQFPQLSRRLDVTNTGLAQNLILGPAGVRPHLRASSRSTQMHRLLDQRKEHIDALQAQGRARGHPLDLADSAWTVEKVLEPNVTDIETILALARMTLDAYQTVPGTGEWQDIGKPFNFSDSFGWMNDGLRGHIFTDPTNETVVIAIKGTSISLTGFPDGPTGSVEKDRRNDNLLFSCCCGKGNLFVHPVCSCATDKNTCNSTCMSDSMQQSNTYYTLAKELYWNVTELYPTANIWLTGHSLGGAMAALLGATVFRPAVTFEAPAEAMAAKRLGLPVPPKYHLGVASQGAEFNKGAYHFGHTADPIFMSTCSGLPCSLDGFFFQSHCHSGHVCTWDAQKDLGWSRSIINHRIITVINDLLPKYNVTPQCEIRSNCTDCPDWKFYESHHSEHATTTTSSISTSVTCTSPGWWGCLDPTSTSYASSTSITSSTSTCMTPGWFGCKDRTSATTTTITSPLVITTLTSTSSSTTCATPGWFGCKDPTTTTSNTSASTSTVASRATTATCSTPGWFGCKDRTTSVVDSPTTASPQHLGAAHTARPTL